MTILLQKRRALMQQAYKFADYILFVSV